MIDQGCGQCVGVADGQAPWLLHRPRLDTDNGTHLIGVPRGDPRTPQLARAPRLANPLGGRARLARLVGDVDVAAEADDVAEAQFGEEFEQLVIAETAVGEDCHMASGWHDLRQSYETCIFESVALLRQLFFPDGQPQQRRRSAMAGHQIEGKCRLTVVVKVGPVHGDDNLSACAHQMRDPVCEALPDVDLFIAEQSVNLLDGVLGHQAARQRQGLADHRDGKRGADHHAKRGACQSIDPLGMDRAAIQLANERSNVLQPPAEPALRLFHETLPSCRNTGFGRKSTRIDARPRVIKMRGFLSPLGSPLQTFRGASDSYTRPSRAKYCDRTKIHAPDLWSWMRTIHLIEPSR